MANEFLSQGNGDLELIYIDDVELIDLYVNKNLWLWGQGNVGQLGDGTTVSKSSPVQTVAGGTNWRQVSAGATHTACIKTDGTLWLWGQNQDGRLVTTLQPIGLLQCRLWQLVPTGARCQLTAILQRSRQTRPCGSGVPVTSAA